MRDLRGRFLLLLGLRWFATGLIIPVVLLLPLSRGLSVSEVGAVMAAQGVVVLLTEIPSGALTDAWGRRPVFVASAVMAAVAYGATLLAHSLLAFVVAWSLTGLFRALDSGPLEAWFVDAERARGAAAEVPTGLALAGSVVGGSIAAGSLMTAGLLAFSPWSQDVTLSLPYALAMAVVIGQIVAALLLMERPGRRGPVTWHGAVGGGVSQAFGPHLRGLLLVMVLVGLGVTALELFMPVRVNEFSSRATAAGTVMGLASAAAWGLGSVGAAVAARVLRHRSPAPVAAILVGAESIGLVAMAVAGGLPVLLLGYWTCYLVHTSFGAAYNSLVHARVADERRGTVLSVTSMAFLGSAAAGSIGLGALAERTSAPTALLVGAGALLAASLVTWRQR